jgi:dephospho-CoA kinase
MSAHAQARVVLCGGIGSGKSTAGELLAALGADVIDADEAGHRVLDPDGDAFGAVASRWPQAVKDGVIDRRVLGRIVFGDPLELAELEAATHPAIRAFILRRVARSASDVVVVEVPILSDFLGPGWTRALVDAPDDRRKERLLARGMTAEEIGRRMAAQPTRQQWLDAADYVIDNSGSLQDLELAVARFISELRDGSSPAP